MPRAKYRIEVELESHEDIEQVLDSTRRALNNYFDDNVKKIRVSSTIEFNSEPPCQEQSQ